MTTTGEPFLNAPKIPSLAAWLGDGIRADGFEEFVTTVLAAQELETDARDQLGLRMFRTFLIAAVETGRTELQRGQPYEDIVSMMARAAGAAVMAAVLSGIREDSPKMRVARLLGDDFVDGAKAIIKSSAKASAG